MDDLDKLSQGLRGGAGAQNAIDATGTPGGLALAGALEAQGGLDGLLAKLRAAGLGDQVDSWISTGPNQPIDPRQLKAAIGDDGAQRLAGATGLDVSALLPMLAAFLPQIIDMLTPDGTVPAGGLNGATAVGGLPDLGGLLGGMLGGAGAGGAGRAGTSGAGGAGGLDDLLGGLGGMLGGDKGR